MKQFWQFRNAADGGAELLLYGDIASEQSWFGDEVTPKQFARDLEAAGAGDLTVRINSCGGDVFAAAAIGNLLESRPGQTTARIDGVCASAATIVACHCGKVIAAADSTYMIHPVTIFAGYAGETELKQYMDALGTIRENIVGLYAKKTGRDEAEVAAEMDATSWWTAAQAQEKGFVDEIAGSADVRVENRDGVLFVNRVSMGLPFAAAPKFVQESLAPADAESGLFANRPQAQAPEAREEEQEMEIRSIDDLRTSYPELVDQLEREAAESAAQAERARIQGIEDMALPGSEELAERAKFTTPMTAENFAVEMVKGAKERGATFLDAMRQDAADSGAEEVDNAPAPLAENSVDAVRAQAKADAQKYLARKNGRDKA